ncbi:hypothetical protein DFH27DRAFT_615073 [Peziza echinospora]|nr:hypothetical protein DFH27DRAFT_615073 [Peziza echinospora]
MDRQTRHSKWGCGLAALEMAMGSVGPDWATGMRYPEVRFEVGKSKCLAALWWNLRALNLNAINFISFESELIL